MKDYYEPFELIKYERISDEILRLNYEIVLKINANFTRSYKDNRSFFYKEYEYVNGGRARISVKRSFDYYVTLEDISTPKGREKIYVRFNTWDLYALSQALDQVSKWFTAKEFKKLFVAVGNSMGIGMSPVPTVELPGLPMNTSITFAPCIIDTGYKFKQGTQLTITTENTVVSQEISIDAVFGLQYLLRTFNPFQAAQGLINSVCIPLGTNRFDITDNGGGNPLPYSSEPMIKEDKNKNIEGRFIGGFKKPTIESLEGDD